MILTKLGHACVRLEQNGVTLVIDPGMFTEPEALAGVDAVLITHEHFDHFVEARLRAALEADPALHVWTNASVAAQLDGVRQRVTVVGEGDAFEVGSLGVTVHGEWHAVIHPDIPRVGNIGFTVDGRLFHPGDALTLPPHAVDTLLVPAGAPWSKASEMIDYVRAAGPGRAVAIHEAVLSDVGQQLYGRLLGEGGPGTGAPYRQLASGEQLDLG
ncbi:MBL fold metallo-hydrolase [Kitasatospora sp. NPDC057223]|uniref:MBL fold metallo-hydrolase n=1 Tax=Kitasatospora sp. NPDC057223 TaxID=3346055 RepID=UPI003637BA97